MTIVKHAHYKYIEDAIVWINKNNIDVISILDAGRFSEGFYVVYRTVVESH